MKLGEALQIIRDKSPEAARTRRINLVCGFEPLHLTTFLKAHALNLEPRANVEIRTGLYGDLIGNLERAGSSPAETVLCLEWADLDRRLGWRSSAKWGLQALDDILSNVGSALKRLGDAIKVLTGSGVPIVILSPGLPLPPVIPSGEPLASSLELQLNAALTESLAEWSTMGAVRTVNPLRIAALSHPSSRFDLRSELKTGFPFTLAYASTLGRLAAQALSVRVPKKGLISDLDDTMWRGILGDDGISGISNALSGDGQLQALYQQTLTALASSGVLLAVCSKNDRDLAIEALTRPDQIAKAELFFPIEAGWGAKSEAVARILDVWNIGDESVVFVDDSEIELDEVKARFPGMETVRFPKENPAELEVLLFRLSDWFAKPVSSAEDLIRSKSLREHTRFEAERKSTDPDSFLSTLQAEVSFKLSRDVTDSRAFELLNKTNQFNINGRRFTESEWLEFFGATDNYLLTAEYRDKYGPLGKIAALLLSTTPHECYVTAWVMSCRAFSRRIEYQTLATIFELLGPDRVMLRYSPTERNGPVLEFLKSLNVVIPDKGTTAISREGLASVQPALFHTVKTERVG